MKIQSPMIKIWSKKGKHGKEIMHPKSTHSTHLVQHKHPTTQAVVSQTRASSLTFACSTQNSFPGQQQPMTARSSSSCLQSYHWRDNCNGITTELVHSDKGDIPWQIKTLTFPGRGVIPWFHVHLCVLWRHDRLPLLGCLITNCYFNVVIASRLIDRLVRHFVS